MLQPFQPRPLLQPPIICPKNEKTTVKNPSPEDPALIAPQGDGVYLLTSNGMMEWWNNGILGLKSEIILILYYYFKNRSKKDLILMNPLFQHTSIPSPQDICLWHSQLPLTWPSFRPVGLQPGGRARISMFDLKFVFEFTNQST